MKINPDMIVPIQNADRAAQMERSQANEDAIKTQGVAQSAVVPPQDIVQTTSVVAKIEGTPIDVGAPPPAPSVAQGDNGAAASVFAENTNAAIGSAGSAALSNPTADNLARAFMAQQVFTDRQDIEAEQELMTVSSNLTQLAIANAKKEIERLQAELEKAEKQGGGGLFGGGFMGSMMKILDPIGSMMMKQMSDMAGGNKVEQLQAKLDNAHKRLAGLVNNLMAIGKHMRQLQEARLKEGAQQIAQETVQTGPDGVPKGMQDKMKAALGDGIAALMGKEGVTLDQAVVSLTDRACEVLEAHGIQVTDAVKAQVGASIRTNLFDQEPALDAVKTGIDVVAQYSETASQQAQNPRTVIG